MKINTINFNNYNFKSATLSTNAISDTHGQLSLMAKLCHEIENNKDELFLEEKQGNKNVFAIAGDWFMAGDVKGYKTKPQYNSQKYQLLFFNKFLIFLHKLAPHMPVLFSPGNHEFDAGEDEFVKTMEGIHANVVMTNANFENSPSIKELADKNKIIKSKIIDIQDDKNPKLHHKVLFVSAVPGNMNYYNKKIKNIDFSENVYKPQKKLTSKDVQNSIEALRLEIEKFKSDNPKGAVVLMDHFAGIFQKELLNHNLPINVILSAHEHEDERNLVNKTLIVKLSQNFDKIENIKIKFDDNGNLEEITSKAFKNQDDKSNNFIKDFYNKIFHKDLEKKYIIPAQDGVKFSIRGIRYQNNYLANYINDVLLHQIKKQYPQTDIFAINASAIRGSLITAEEGETDNTHLICVLNGIKQEDADIMISKVSGQELIEMICDNILYNEADHKRNPLMQYSGITIDKENILSLLKKGIEPKFLCSFVRTTKDNLPLDENKIYNCANVEKFFLKSKNDLIKKLYEDKERTFKTTLNARREFQKYFEENSQEVVAKKETRYY